MVEAREKWVDELDRGAGEGAGGTVCISGCNGRLCAGAFDSPSARLQLRTVAPGRVDQRPASALLLLHFPAFILDLRAAADRQVPCLQQTDRHFHF